MAMYVTKEITDAYEMQNEFAEYDRDYYSEEAYEYILDYFDEEELDVIAICCACTEYDIEDFVTDYEHEGTFTDFLIDNNLADEYCEEHNIDIEDFTDEMAEEFKGCAEYEDYIDWLKDSIASALVEMLDNGNILVIE